MSLLTHDTLEVQVESPGVTIVHDGTVRLAEAPAGGVHTPGLEPPLIHRQSLVGLAELALQDVHPPLVQGSQEFPSQYRPLLVGQTLQEGGLVAPLLHTWFVHPPLAHASQLFPSHAEFEAQSATTPL